MMIATRLLVVGLSLATILALRTEAPKRVEGYRCSSFPGTCEVVSASRDGSSVTMRVATLPKSGVIRLKTPNAKLRVDLPELPGNGVEDCSAEITCADGKTKGCGTVTNATAWACSAGGGAATCMYLDAELDEWQVVTVTCND